MRFRWFRVLVQLGVGAVILLWLLQIADISKVFSTLLTVNPLNLVLASIFFIIASTFVALALYAPLRTANPHISVRRVIMASFAGQLLSDVTPARSGYFLTPFVLNRLCGVSTSTGLSAVLATGAINSFVKVALSLLALMYFLRFLPLDSALINALVIGMLVLFLGGLCLFILMLGKYIPMWIKRLERLPVIGRVLCKIADTFSHIRKEGQRVKGSLVQVAIFILLSVVANAIALYFISSTLWLNTPTLLEFVLIVSLTSVLMYVPVTMAGLGVQEAGYVLLLTLHGIPLESAVAFALLTRILFTGTDVMGLPILIKVGYKV